MSAKSTVKLPRLRTKDELLKTSPELFNKLLLGEEMSSARSNAPAQPKQSSVRAVQSASHGQPSRPTSKGIAAYDTPRGFGDEPLTVDQELAIELESVKRERQQLLDSINQLKAESGTAGGEAQQADIRQLLKELELKKAKLNELKGESRKAEASIAKMRDDDTDAQRLTPDDCMEENAYIQNLRDEMNRVEEDLLEADAKNRLYYLLGERTRREHMAIDQKVRDKQDSKRACLEDLANLTEHFNATRAAKELGEKELAKIKRQVEEARSDWMRKIRERRAEVRELKKRQQKEREKEVKRREKQLEKEKAERAAQAKLKMEQEAYQLQVAALAPKIEAMEASWNRLRAISGAETPDQVVEYWQGLKAKEQRMHELVAIAERREAACKEGDEDVETAHARIEAAERRMDMTQVQFNKLRSICIAAEQGMRSLLQRLATALDEPAAAAAAHSHPAPVSSAAAAPVAMQGSAGQRLQSAGASSTGGSSHTGGLDGLRRSTGGGLGSRQGRPAREGLSSTGSAGAASDNPLASKVAKLGSASRARPSDSSSAVPLISLAGVPEDASAAPSQSGTATAAAAGTRPTLPSRGKNTIDDDVFFEGLPELLADVTQRLERLLTAGESIDYQAVRVAAAAAAASTESTSFVNAAGSHASTAAPTANPTPRVRPDAGFVAAAAEAAELAARASGSGNVQHAAEGAEEGATASSDGGEARASEMQEPADVEVAGELQQDEAGQDHIAEDEQHEGDAAAGGEGDEEAAAAVEGGKEHETASGLSAADDEAVQQLAGEVNESRLPAEAAHEDHDPQQQQAAAASVLPAGEPAGDLLTTTGRPISGLTGTHGRPSVMFRSTAAPSVPAAALAVGGTMNSPIPDSEKALMKGLPSDNPLDMNLVPSMKRKKGKKKEAAGVPDLTRILGYTPPTDVPAESDSDGEQDDGDGSGGGADGVVDREWIKMRAAKMTARHNAKQAAAAAAAQLSGGGR
eukprot:gene5882-6123_t